MAESFLENSLEILTLTGQQQPSLSEQSPGDDLDKVCATVVQKNSTCLICFSYRRYFQDSPYSQTISMGLYQSHWIQTVAMSSSISMR